MCNILFYKKLKQKIFYAQAGFELTDFWVKHAMRFIHSAIRANENFSKKNYRIIIHSTTPQFDLSPWEPKEDNHCAACNFRTTASSGT